MFKKKERKQQDAERGKGAGGYGIGQTEAGSRVKKQGRGVQRGVEEESGRAGSVVFV